MFLYFSILFGCLIVSLGNINKYKRIEQILIFLLALFFCCGYMTGSDWRNYETYYTWLENGISGFSIEPGYLFLSVIFHFFDIPFWPFFILIKICAFYCILHFLRQYSFKYHFFSITFFLFIFGLFLFIDNPMRNLLAICISYFSYKYLENKEWYKFFFIVLLAVFFHTSAILLLLIFPFYPIKLSNNKILILFLIFNIFFVSFYEFIILKIIGSFSFIPIIERKLLLYFIDGTGLENIQLISLGFIIQFILFILILYKRKYIESLPYGKLVFWGFMCYVFLYRIASIISIFYRLQLYMCVFYAIGVSYIFISLTRRSNKIIYVIFLTCYLSYMTYSLITSSYKYIPYTNYIQYMFKSDIPFNYRSEYNHINSPYEINTISSE